jgi:hypothetical protein
MTAQRYVHLPTEVDAFQWNGNYNDLPQEWRASGAFRYSDGHLSVVTGKGEADIRIGDFILFSDWEEFWPISESKFLASYRAKS